MGAFNLFPVFAVGDPSPYFLSFCWGWGFQNVIVCFKVIALQGMGALITMFKCLIGYSSINDWGVMEAAIRAFLRLES